jgi:hypothetical protein
MRNFQSLTDGDLRDLLTDLERRMDADGCRSAATEELAWEIEEELHLRHLEAMEAA